MEVRNFGETTLNEVRDKLGELRRSDDKAKNEDAAKTAFDQELRKKHAVAVSLAPPELPRIEVAAVPSAADLKPAEPKLTFGAKRNPR